MPPYAVAGFVTACGAQGQAWSVSLTALAVRGNLLHDIVGSLYKQSSDAGGGPVAEQMSIKVSGASELLEVVARIREAATSGDAAHTVVTLHVECGSAGVGRGETHTVLSVVVLAAEDEAGHTRDVSLRVGAASVAAALEDLQLYNRAPSPVCTLTALLGVRVLGRAITIY